MFRIVGFCLAFMVQLCIAQTELRGPPRVEKNPRFSESYIPAAMQIIAHATELMKYEMKPQPGTTTTTTTTLRPTPSHKPAIFAPTNPIGPTAYFAKNTREEYVKLLQQPSGPNYFDRYYSLLPPDSQAKALNLDLPNDVGKYFGRGYLDLLRVANSIDSDFTSKDADTQVQSFAKDFEDPDSRYRYELLRQKKAPPTKAYVTLLSLYDALNKESKRLLLNKYSGYNEAVLKDLVASSANDASYQLKFVLQKIVDNQDTKKPDIIQKVKNVINDFNQDSYLNEALMHIPPLVFAF